MSRLTDSIPKGSIFWIKWELEDLDGKKFVPPQYHYYNAKATGKKRNNMFQVEYDDGTKEYYSIRGINTRTKNILTDAAYNNGEIITAEEKQPRVGPEFQAVVDASPGPELPNSKFRQNALQLVPLTNKEIEDQDASTELSAAVQADMNKSGLSKTGYEGGKPSVSKEAVSYFEEFPLYDIGADALSALEILGGGRRSKKKTRKRRKGGRKKTRKKRKRKKTRRKRRKRKRRTKKAGLTPRSKLEEGIEGCIKLKESNKIRDCRNIGGLKKYHQEQTKKSFFKKIHLPHRPHFHRETKTERHNREMRDMEWDLGSFGKN